jgi:hypothetical protein
LSGKISDTEARGVGIPGREMAAGRRMIERIVIETETPGDSRTMFRVRMDDLVIGQNLTAAQAHLIVGEVLDRIALPRPSKTAFGAIITRPLPRSAERSPIDVLERFSCDLESHVADAVECGLLQRCQ